MGVSRILATLLCVVLVAPLAGAQQTSRVVKGSKGTLKGVTVICLDVKGDALLGELLAREIARQLPQIAIVEPGTPGALVVDIARGFVERKDGVGGEPGAGIAGPSRAQRLAVQGDSLEDGLASLRARPNVVRECWVVGAVLRPVGEGEVAEVFKYRQLASRGLETVMRDFAGKLAKEYRKANPGEPALVAGGKSR
jgi:hypothetical protein